MENDFLRDLEYLGITARIKRLSDVLSTSIRELYKIQGLEIEPSWHLVFLILKRKKSASMGEVAADLNLSQPALTKMVRRMISKGYIEVFRDESDFRKKILRLSSKAEAEFPKFEILWEAGCKAVKEIMELNPEFSGALEQFEDAVYQKSFKDRAIGYLETD